MRKLIIIVGLVLLVVGGVAIWRQMHPVLSAEEQIAANLEDLARAASGKRLSGIMTYLDKDFKYGSMGRKDVQSSLAAAFWQFRKIDVQISGVKIQVNQDTAMSTGHYTVATQRETTSPPDTSAGDFKIGWKRQDGEWKAVNAEGGQLPGF